MRFVLMIMLGSLMAATASTTATDEAAIAATEAEINHAIEQKDVAALDRLWATEYTFINPAGILQTKADRLKLLDSGELKVEAITYDQISSRFYGDVAVVTARSTVHGQRRGTDIGIQRRVTSVFVRRDGRWQVVAQQSTLIAQKTNDAASTKQ